MAALPRLSLIIPLAARDGGSRALVEARHGLVLSSKRYHIDQLRQVYRSAASSLFLEIQGVAVVA